MKTLFLLLLSNAAFAVSLPPTPFPVFLKNGFSSVLEFEEAPVRVVLGDSQSFQVEKLERSLIIKTLAPYASSNMFVYFNAREPRLFILTASEDAEPTYYKRFEPPVVPKKELPPSPTGIAVSLKRGAKVVLCKFDDKKDYLTVEIQISADSREIIKPSWSLARIKYNSTFIAPNKLWAERQDVQKDSRVKARFIFAKPNIPNNLRDVFLIVPILGSPNAITLAMRGDKP